MTRLRKSILIVSIALTISCAKEPPNLTPVVHAQFVSDRYLSALSDFEDGVEVGYNAGWLSQKDTYTVAQILGVTGVAIHASPDGARAIALAAITEIQSKVDLAKFAPYLNSVRLVIEGL
jgi:hypothetical protein